MNQSMQKSSKIQDLCKQGLMCDIFYSQLSLVHTLWCPTVVPAYRPSTCSNTQIGFQATTTLHTRRSCDQSETQHGCSGHKTSWRYTSPSNCIGIKGLGGIFWHQSPPLKRKNNVQPKFRPSLIAKAWCEQWHWFCGAGLGHWILGHQQGQELLGILAEDATVAADLGIPNLFCLVQQRLKT